MKHPPLLWTLLLAALVAVGCAGHDAHDDDHHDGSRAAAAHQDDDGDEAEDEDGDDEEIAISAVPANVLAAARKAAPGVTFEEAEVETENGVVVYSLEGLKDGIEYEVEVSADGRVLEVERDDEDNAHDDD